MEQLLRSQTPKWKLWVDGKDGFLTQGVIKTSWRGYRTTLTDKYYIDFDNLTSDPDAAKKILEQYSELINNLSNQKKINYLGFIQKEMGTVGALKMSIALSILSGIPNILIRESKEIYFDKIKIPGKPTLKKNEQLLGSNTLIITDHITTGKEVIEAVDIIEKNGGKVTDIITCTLRTDRFDPQPFKKQNIGYHSIYQIPDDLPLEAALKIEKSK